VLLLLIFLPSSVSASPAPVSPAPLDALDNILASPDFGASEDHWVIRLKNQSSVQKEPAHAPKIDGVRPILAWALRLIVIALATFFIVRAIFLLRKSTAKSAMPSPADSRLLSGQPPLDPEALLHDAAGLYAQGRIRDAWAACLSAGMGLLSYRVHKPIPPGATEYDCLAMAHSLREEDVSGFSALVQDWIALAYQGKAPEAGAFEQNLRFCEGLLTHWKIGGQNA
jgi:hypothetical protein